MDYRFYQIMYQQWSNGQSNPASRYMDFIKMASKQGGINPDTLKKELIRCSWFKHTEN